VQKVSGFRPPVTPLKSNAEETIFTSPFTEIISSKYQDLVFRIGEIVQVTRSYFALQEAVAIVAWFRTGLWFYQF
jgi:hypothetical protein